jgi:hypothetical protein
MMAQFASSCVEVSSPFVHGGTWYMDTVAIDRTKGSRKVFLCRAISGATAAAANGTAPV